MGRTYSCWMLNCWCITWPVGFKRLTYRCNSLNSSCQGVYAFNWYLCVLRHREICWWNSLVGPEVQFYASFPSVVFLLFFPPAALPAPGGIPALASAWCEVSRNSFTRTRYVLTHFMTHSFIHMEPTTVTRTSLLCVTCVRYVVMKLFVQRLAGFVQRFG